MECDVKDLELALVEGRITIEQFIEVLVDNFGESQARKILNHNIRLALHNEKKRNQNNGKA